MVGAGARGRVVTEPDIFLGPPGTGKTHALVDVLRGELAAGTPPGRIGLVTFTRRAAQEAIEETKEATGVPAANMGPRLLQAAKLRPGSASLDQVIGVELKTSAKAYDGPPTDPKKFEEQQKQLQDELQKRAEEARKKLEGQQATPTR